MTMFQDRKTGEQFEFPVGRMVAISLEESDEHTFMLHLDAVQASLLVSAMDNLDHEYGLDDIGQDLYENLVFVTSVGETRQ